MDPNDPNSDDIGPDDGGEDFDGDSLTNSQDIGSGFEATNWNSYDNDTTSDACEDADEDYLTTAQELQNTPEVVAPCTAIVKDPSLLGEDS